VDMKHRDHEWRKIHITPVKQRVFYVLIGLMWIFFSGWLMTHWVQYPVTVFGLWIFGTVVVPVVLLILFRQHKALRDTREEYRLFVERIRQPILIHGDGIILDANRYAVDLFCARNKEELIGKPVFDFVCPEYREVVQERIGRLKQGIVTDALEEQILTLTGEVRVVEIVGVPVTYNGRPAIKCMIRDMTQRKQTEENLKRVAELFRLLEQNMTDAIAVMNVDGTAEYISPSHTHLIGRHLVAEDGKYISEAVHPDDLPRIKTLFQGHSPFRTECRVKHASGRWITVEMSGVPVIDEQQNVKRMVLVCRDITERKESEAMLRKSDKLAAVGELAAGVAHEIRNPLTALKGFTQILRAKASSHDLPFYEIMHNELQRIEVITNELLMLAKPRECKFKAVQVVSIVQEVITLLSSRAVLNNVQIHQEFEQNTPMVQCDENQLKQVFINVIKNAIEAMPRGGNLYVRIQSQGDRVYLEFVDEGNGIAAEHLPLIGQPFFTTKETGTGLGLMVSYKIIQGHGGTMDIQSQVGSGTTVTISLPAVTMASDQLRNHTRENFVNTDSFGIAQ
jgi:two-component system sporulation sensor kinase A